MGAAAAGQPATGALSEGAVTGGVDSEPPAAAAASTSARAARFKVFIGISIQVGRQLSQSAAERQL